MADKTNTPEQPAAKPTIEGLLAENAELKAKLVSYETAATQAVADEGDIQERMQGGLTREQAIQVVREQREHDARLAAAKGAKK